MQGRAIYALPSNTSNQDIIGIINPVEYNDTRGWKVAVKNSKALFFSSALVSMILMFLGVDAGLEQLYSLGHAQTLITAGMAAGIIVLLFVWQSESTFIGLVIGTLLWAIVGEIASHYGWADMLSMRNILLLALIAVFVIYLVIKDILPWHIMTSCTLFVTLWSFRFIAANLGTRPGPDHTAAFLTVSLFAVIIAGSAIFAWNTKRQDDLTICSILIASSIWIIVRLMWVWELIPRLKPG